MLNRDFLGIFSPFKPSETDIARMTRYFGYSPPKITVKNRLYLFGDYQVYEAPNAFLAVTGYTLPKLDNQFINKLSLIPEETLNTLEGLYRIIFYDFSKHLLLLSADFWGKRTIYYRFMQETLIFGSLPSVLAGWADSSPELDVSGLQHFASFAYTPPPYTFFKGVHEIPWGCFLSIKIGEDPKIKRFWKFKLPKQRKSFAENEFEEFRELIKESVKTRINLIKTTPAFFSSGGLDTSTVIWAGRDYLKTESLNAYTVGFDLPTKDLIQEYDEGRYAKRVNEYFKTNYNLISITCNQIERLILPAIHAMAKPSGDALNTYFSMSGLKQKELHVFSGTGGDEIFYGILFYPFLNWMKRRAYVHLIPHFIRKILYTKLNQSFSFKKRIIAAYFKDTLLAQYSVWRIQQQKHELEEYFSPEIAKNLFIAEDEIKHQLSWVEDWQEWQQLFFLMLRNEVAAIQLRDIEYMTQRFSCNVWAPLLDKKILEFMFSLPFEKAAIPNVSKPIMQKAVRNILPKEIMERQKRGFIIPMQVWLKNDLNFLVDKIIFKGKHKELGFWNHEHIVKLAEKLNKPQPGYSYFRVWNVILTYIWYRLHIIEKRETPPGIPLKDWLEQRF